MTGRLVVIEGLDGSGKNTLAGRLTRSWRGAGLSVGEGAFPRYGESIHADLIQDALYGRLGDLADSVYGSALLFALDRRDAADEIRRQLATCDLVLLDRYVASNAAYGAARLGGPVEPTDFPRWVAELELGRFGLPRPDLQVLLATETTVAAQRARARAVADPGRALDSFEKDQALQQRTSQMYRTLAAEQYLSPWLVLGGEATVDPMAIAEQAAGR